MESAVEFAGEPTCPPAKKSLSLSWQVAAQPLILVGCRTDEINQQQQRQQQPAAAEARTTFIAE